MENPFKKPTQGLSLEPRPEEELGLKDLKTDEEARLGIEHELITSPIAILVKGLGFDIASNEGQYLARELRGKEAELKRIGKGDDEIAMVIIDEGKKLARPLKENK